MSKTWIYPTAEVSEAAVIGMGTKIWNQAQVREGAHIGERCIISKNVYIDENVSISVISIRNWQKPLANTYTNH